VSRETTEARAVARASAADWKRHKATCPACAMATDKRKRGDLCPVGAKLLGQQAADAAELAENRRLDKMPSPDQEPLF